MHGKCQTKILNQIRSFDTGWILCLPYAYSDVIHKFFALLYLRPFGHDSRDTERATKDMHSLFPLVGLNVQCLADLKLW